MALKIIARISSTALAAGLAIMVSSSVSFALSQQEPQKPAPESPQLILGDENSDAMPTGSIEKVDSGSCEKGSSNLKVPGQKKAYVPEETP